MTVRKKAKLTDAQIQQKLEQLVELTNELSEEAKRRWGRDGNLFFESEGNFYLMTGDCDGTSTERQKHIRFRSIGVSLLGAGAW